MVTITNCVFYTIGFNHSAFVFAQEANMYENRFNDYRLPSGMLIVFLEKALTLIHMETHLDDVSAVLSSFCLIITCDESDLSVNVIKSIILYRKHFQRHS